MRFSLVSSLVGAAAAAALIGAAPAGAVPDTDPVADLLGTASWTESIDNLLVSSLGSAETTALDGTVDGFQSADLDPWLDLVQTFDPTAGSNPADPLGDLANLMDYGLNDLPVLFAPTGLDPTLIDPLVNFSNEITGSFDLALGSLLGI